MPYIAILEYELQNEKSLQDVLSKHENRFSKFYLDSSRDFKINSREEQLVKFNEITRLSDNSKLYLKQQFFNFIYHEFKMKFNEVMELLEKIEFIKIEPYGKIVLYDNNTKELPFIAIIRGTLGQIEYLASTGFKEPYIINLSYEAVISKGGRRSGFLFDDIVMYFTDDKYKSLYENLNVIELDSDIDEYINANNLNIDYEKINL